MWLSWARDGGVFLVAVTPQIVALVPYGLAMVGAHVRPVDHLELGATLGVPFPLFSVGALEMQPALAAKAWF